VPGEPVLRENLIRLAAVDFLTFARGPWGHDLKGPSGPPCPHWHGSHPRFQALLEEYAPDVEQ
jgi:hypothetical protein